MSGTMPWHDDRRELGWPLAAAQAKPTTLVAFDYEHDGGGVPYQMCPVDGDPLAGLGQIITMPPQAEDVCGVRFKVTRVGSPGRLLYRLGRTSGGSEIASGAIAADDVVPLILIAVRRGFFRTKGDPRPKAVPDLTGPAGKISRGLLSDLRSATGTRRPGRAQGEPSLRPGRRGFRSHIICGPRWGRAIRPAEKSGLRLSGTSSSPPTSHARRLRNPDRKPRPEETAIDLSWTIVGPPRGNRVIDTAIEDLEPISIVAWRFTWPFRGRNYRLRRSSENGSSSWEKRPGCRPNWPPG